MDFKRSTVGRQENSQLKAGRVGCRSKQRPAHGTFQREPFGCQPVQVSSEKRGGLVKPTSTGKVMINNQRSKINLWISGKTWVNLPCPDYGQSASSPNGVLHSEIWRAAQRSLNRGTVVSLRPQPQPTIPAGMCQRFGA